MVTRRTGPIYLAPTLESACNSKKPQTVLVTGIETTRCRKTLPKRIKAIAVFGMAALAVATPILTPAQVAAAEPQIITQNGTSETRALFANLKILAKDHVMMGQHRSYDMGVHGGKGRSDMQVATGSHPAVVSFDLGGGRRLAPIAEHAIYHFKQGGLVSFSAHQVNPVTGGRYNDLSQNPVRQVLQVGSDAHKTYTRRLRDYALLLNSLEVDGVKIPIVWRPLHENNGGWFWWGSKNCTPQEYKDLWKLTVEYMRDAMQVNNVLWAYSPSRPTTREIYLDRYPGDDYVDIIGFDHYIMKDKSENFVKSAEVVATLARERGKVAACTESGVQEGFQKTKRSDWFTRTWLSPLQSNSAAKELAWILLWSPGRSHFTYENGSNSHVYDDFIRFTEDEMVLLLNDLKNVPSLYAR